MIKLFKKKLTKRKVLKLLEKPDTKAEYIFDSDEIFIIKIYGPSTKKTTKKHE